MASKGLERTQNLRRTFPGNSIYEAIRIKSEGDFYEMLNNYSRAERRYQKALRMMQETDMYYSLEYVGTLSNLATLFTNLGRLPVAEEYYEECMDILAEFQEVDDIISTLQLNMARLSLELGNYEEAEALYLQVLTEDSLYYGPMSAPYGLTLYNLGLNYAEAGDYRKALEYNLRALKNFEVSRSEEDPVKAYPLNNLIRIYSHLENTELAFSYSEQAIEQYESAYGEGHVETSFPYFNTGNVYMITGQLKRATDLHEKALKIRRKKVGNKHPYHALSTRQLAILEWKKGNREKALDYFEETFDNYFHQINTYSNGRTKNPILLQ